MAALVNISPLPHIGFKQVFYYCIFTGVILYPCRYFRNAKLPASPDPLMAENYDIVPCDYYGFNYTACTN